MDNKLSTHKESHGEGGFIKLLTPEIAKKYLDQKPEYKKIRDELIPSFFSAEDFCAILNKIRAKRIQETEYIKQQIYEIMKNNFCEEDEQKIQSLKKEKNAIFSKILWEISNAEIFSKIRNTSIEIKEVRQLIGSLVNFNKRKKTKNNQENLQNTKEPIKEPVKKFVQITIGDIIETNKEELYENLDFGAYEEEILQIRDSLIDQFFFNKELGNTISDAEKKEFARQARKVFLQRYKEEIENGKIDVDKLMEYLSKKNIL